MQEHITNDSVMNTHSKRSLLCIITFLVRAIYKSTELITILGLFGTLTAQLLINGYQN